MFDSNDPLTTTTHLLENDHHSLLEVFLVVGPVHLVGPRLVEVAVVVRSHDTQTLLLLRVGALYQLEEESADSRDFLCERSGSWRQRDCE